mmetsp:Transcript_8765/g.24958  ORF Transcript_8765/g.24958 Transcript_8765/m.24958 type:complete len:273 (-) Transcript_8765:610-1428(-)
MGCSVSSTKETSSAVPGGGAPREISASSAWTRRSPSSFTRCNASSSARATASSWRRSATTTTMLLAPSLGGAPLAAGGASSSAAQRSVRTRRSCSRASRAALSATRSCARSRRAARSASRAAARCSAARTRASLPSTGASTAAVAALARSLLLCSTKAATSPKFLRFRGDSAEVGVPLLSVAMAGASQATTSWSTMRRVNWSTPMVSPPSGATAAEAWGGVFRSTLASPVPVPWPEPKSPANAVWRSRGATSVRLFMLQASWIRATMISCGI